MSVCMYVVPPAVVNIFYDLEFTGQSYGTAVENYNLL